MVKSDKKKIEKDLKEYLISLAKERVLEVKDNYPDGRGPKTENGVYFKTLTCGGVKPESGLMKTFPIKDNQKAIDIFKHTLKYHFNKFLPPLTDTLCVRQYAQYNEFEGKCAITARIAFDTFDLEHDFIACPIE